MRKKTKQNQTKKEEKRNQFFFQFKGSSLFEIFEKWSKNNSLYVTCSSARDENGYHTTFLEQADLSWSYCIIVTVTMESLSK